MVQQSKLDLARVIVEVSRSHTHTHTHGRTPVNKSVAEAATYTAHNKHKEYCKFLNQGLWTRLVLAMNPVKPNRMYT